MNRLLFSEEQVIRIMNELSLPKTVSGYIESEDRQDAGRLLCFY